jgi:hypothetical protein
MAAIGSLAVVRAARLTNDW